MDPDLRYWRTRFLMIPVETITPSIRKFVNPDGNDLNDEEMKIAGLKKFLQILEQPKWLKGSTEARRTMSGAELHVPPTTFSAAGYVRDEIEKQLGSDAHDGSSLPSLHLPSAMSSLSSLSSRKASVSEPASDAGSELGVLTTASSHATIALAMQNPAYGLLITTRRWQFRTYENVFIGNECVGWLLEHFHDLATREDAVAFGQGLIDAGVFQHINGRHGFLDGHYFYTFKKDAGLGTPPVAAGPLSSWSPTFYSIVSSPSRFAKISLNNLAAMKVPVADPTRRYFKKVELTRQFVVDMDLKRKSKRREVAFLHYDTIHNARTWYALERNSNMSLTPYRCFLFLFLFFLFFFRFYFNKSIFIYVV